jgi:DNA-directed RNA polymerase specialized sigma24 family protein
VLRYCCDLSVEETARELGCSTGTVKSQAARALDTLRRRMTVEEESPWSS